MILPPESLLTAPCAGVAVDTFFPTRGHEPHQAKALCRACIAEDPDRWLDCARYILRVERACGADQVHGYAAGMTAEERKAIVRDRLPI